MAAVGVADLAVVVAPAPATVPAAADARVAAAARVNPRQCREILVISRNLGL